MHAYLWCFSVLFKIVRPISGESSTKLPIWGHHTQIHRFYGIKRWNTMRKKYLFLEPPIPPWSRWPSDSGKLRGSKNKSIYFFHFWITFWIKKWELLWPLYSRGVVKVKVKEWRFKLFSIFYYLIYEGAFDVCSGPGCKRKQKTAVLYCGVHVRGTT